MEEVKDTALSQFVKTVAIIAKLEDTHSKPKLRLNVIKTATPPPPPKLKITKPCEGTHDYICHSHESHSEFACHSHGSDCETNSDQVKQQVSQPEKQKLKLNIVQEKFRKCSGNRHHKRSTYPTDKVPERLFDNPKKPGSFLKQCLACRQYASSTRKKRETKEKEENKSDDPNFGTCIEYPHEKVSPHPKNRVPIELFNTIRGTKSKACQHCREQIYKDKENKKQRYVQQAKDENKHVCEYCHRICDEEQMSRNREGLVNKFCIPCTQRYTEQNPITKAKIREAFFKIMHERMVEQECCCHLCKNVFLKPQTETLKVEEVETYVKNGSRYVMYNGVEMLSKDFVINYKHLLEFLVMDFDHLTEEEQRERGILKPDEPYVEKVACVSRLHSEGTMRIEAKKCQLICCRCHNIMTMLRAKKLREEREKKNGKPNPTRGIVEKTKRDYVESIKRKGCVVCGFYSDNPLLSGFIEMNHKDPSKKTADISKMITGCYSLQQVKEECSDCEPMCKFCHRLHTRYQIRSGLINNFKVERGRGSNSNSNSDEEEEEYYIEENEELYEDNGKGKEELLEDEENEPAELDLEDYLEEEPKEESEEESYSSCDE